MKYRYCLLILIALLLFNCEVKAQLTAPNVYLQGHWVEIGIARNGSFGPSPAPAGYHPYGTGSNLAMVYDYGHDGWTTGSPPYYGDYVYPGTPFEGWCMQANGARSDAFYTDGAGGSFWDAAAGTSSLTGNNVSYSSAGGVMTGVWQGTTTGTSGGLDIRQTTTLDTEASWVFVTTVIKNTSGTAIPDVYYERTCDPDNSETRSFDFTTTNVITFQNDVDHRVMAGSYGPSGYREAYLALATKDCRAKSMIYQSWPPPEVVPLRLDDMYAGTTSGYGTYYYTLGQTTYADIAIGLIYKLGTIAPGDSTILCYAYIFSDSTAIDVAFPEPALVVNGVTAAPSGPAPAPTYDTFNACLHPGVLTVPVSIINASDKNWSWSKWTWSPSAGLASTTGVTNTITLGGMSGPTTYTITGTDSAVGMYSCNQRVMYLTVYPCFNATNNGPLCLNETLVLHANGDSTGATYFWYGPTGFTAFTQYTSRTGLTMADTGWYYVVRTVGSSHDTARTHVDLKPLPNVTAGSNAPICSGNPNTLLLTATLFAVGETFSWTGPLGFTSVLQNPSIANPPVARSGIYKVVTTLNGCMDSATTNVVIDTTPATPTIGSNSPVCSGHRDTLKLTSSDVTPGVTYTWSGPAGFSSILQNPTIPSPHVPASGTYTVTVSISADGITCKNFNTVNVVVDSTPYLPVMGSNAPICSGNTLLLSATSTAFSTYDWYGPNGFTSAIQNPSIPSAITAATGAYYVSATLAGCTSDTAVLFVVVDSTPEVPTASSNSPGVPSICQRDTLRLTANDATAGVSYSWIGPNSFASTQQNPIIPNVTPAATGVYTITAILGACSASSVITVSITPTPLLIATSNSPVCTGTKDTLYLQATSNPGATFAWTGPYVFTSTLQNPSRSPVIMELAGVYKVIAYLNGCESLPVNDTVIIRPTPPVPMLKNLTFCQYFSAPYIDAYGDSILWYPTNDPSFGGTLTPPKPPTMVDTVIWYYVTQTRMACTSALDSFKVTVNPKPVLTISPSVSVCPHDSVLLIAGTADPLTYYHWAPYLYLSDTVGQSVIARPITNQTYSVTALNKYGCYDTAYVNLHVYAGAVLHLGDDVTLYPGESYQLDAQSNCVSFAWYPPAGLDNAFISNPVATPQISTKYVVHGITSWGCEATDSINININPETLITLPNAFTPGSSANNEFKIIKRGIAQLSYFRIWDRWGVKVFETTDIDKGWDGKYNGKPQPFGVYVYEVGAVTSTGKVFTKHGNVTLVR